MYIEEPSVLSQTVLECPPHLHSKLYVTWSMSCRSDISQPHWDIYTMLQSETKWKHNSLAASALFGGPTREWLLIGRSLRKCMHDFIAECYEIMWICLFSLSPELRQTYGDEFKVSGRNQLFFHYMSLEKHKTNFFSQ